MQYVNEQICRDQVFRYIYKHLSEHEPAPQYEMEKRGMAELGKVLTFVRDNRLYRSFSEKTAYILCSIVAGHYFSNGNKRLGVAVLLQFLVLNAVTWEDLDTAGYRSLLCDTFTDACWEDNPNIGGAHALFLYNLALVIGDRHRWGEGGFDRLKGNVGKLCAHLYRIP